MPFNKNNNNFIHSNKPAPAVTISEAPQLSLINHYRLKKVLPRKHDILISKVKTESEQLNSKNYNTRHIDFSCKIPETEISITKQLSYIDDINSTNLLEWIEEFQTIKTFSKWNEKTSCIVLEQLVAPEYLSAINRYKNSTELLNGIKSLKFSESYAQKLAIDLETTTQNAYYLIGDYYKYIKKLSNQLGNILNESKSQIQMKITNNFMRNLSTELKLELARAKITDVQDMVNYIQEQENIIISEYHNGKINKQQLPSTTNRMINNNVQTNKKFCKYHKSDRHSDEECRVQKASKRQHNSKILTYKEPKTEISLLVLPCMINSTESELLLDTGAENNFVSQTVINKINAQTYTGIQIKAETADGRISVLDKISQLEIKIKGLEQITFKIQAYVLPDSSTDLIIGHKFLVENDTIINYKQKIIQINDLSLEMTTKPFSSPKDDPDKLILQKSQLCTLQSHLLIGKDSPASLTDFLYAAALNNPTLGLIPNVFHKINILQNTTQQCPQYKIPVAIEGKTKEELKRLISLKIIRKSTSSFTSPAFPILKRNGNIRLVVDFRKLNLLTKR